MSESERIVSRAAPVVPTTSTTQSSDAAAVLADPALLLRALVAAMEQRTQAGQSE